MGMLSELILILMSLWLLHSIGMCMKCGYSSWARRIFYQFDIKPADPAFWNAMINGYGRNGQNEPAFEIFDLILEENLELNSTTFIGVLSVCSHTGQVDKGWLVFRTVSRDYGLNPNPEHCGCMVDLLGRSGRLEEAMKLIQDMPEPPASIFASLLGACRHHFHFELGEEMAMKLSELEPGDVSPFVILSNTYAELERWGDVERIKRMINDKGLRKFAGSSSIEVT